MQFSEAIRQFEKRVAPLCARHEVTTAPAPPGAAGALLALAFRNAFCRHVAWIADGTHSLELAHRDLLTLARLARTEGTDQGPVLYYPAWDVFPGKREHGDPDLVGYRLETLTRLAAESGKAPPPPCVVATCVQAMLQRTLTPAGLRDSVLRLAVGDEHELDEFTARLDALGYAFTPQVQEKGQAAVRGGLVDLWPLPQAWPCRIEFEGDTIATMRSFNPLDQKSAGRLTAVKVVPTREHPSRDARDTAGLIDHLPEGTLLIWSDIESIRDHAAACEEAAGEAAARSLVNSLSVLEKTIESRPSCSQWRFGIGLDAASEGPFKGMSALPGLCRLPREAVQPDVLDTARDKLVRELAARAASGQQVIICFDTEGGLSHFKESVGRPLVPSIGPGCHVRLEVATLSEGFICDDPGLVVVAGSDLYGHRRSLDRRYDPEPRRTKPERIAGSRLTDLAQMEPGDLVVHTDHGVGRYMGLRQIVFNGEEQEVLTLEYAEGARLHVPVSQAHLLSRYVGVARHQASLHRLGTKRWNREKEAAEQAIVDLASTLLDIQAHRETLDGFACPGDTHWQHEFEASFPFEETVDQQRVIREVKADMEATRPMDRLICGDAGYGKTEVAMRAAFKTVTAGKQASVLVPTTVLAQQHYSTFTERMSGYPVRVGMLSRFCTRSRQKKTLEGLADGTVDIVIGTHALLQPGVRFKDLGLVIIDEEQRFGVAHKERFKHIRRLVDVLTLTATPIPRTLYMSMTGARDMSLLQTPPRERMAIQTLVARNTENVVREAVLREINREGQVFYLHNRVMTIDMVRRRLERTVPEARVGIAHGQMPSAELARVMGQFVAGEFDVLLCTTIIESGMDIPRANTILIDRADRFGIADLYQLRGRVGRSRRQAYAYLLLPSHGRVDADARKRIGAVRKYSSLSAGFNLALRDLEIRGAGNLLGRQQSGHITAIGFGLYCQLLQRTVARLKGETPPPIIDVDVRLDFIDLAPGETGSPSSAMIPYAYIEDEHLRLAAYRRLAAAATEKDVGELRAEFRDRYGPVPPPVQRLLTIAELKILASDRGITSVEARDGKLMLRRNGDYVMPEDRFPRLLAATADDALTESVRILTSLEM